MKTIYFVNALHVSKKTRKMKALMQKGWSHMGKRFAFAISK